MNHTDSQRNEDDILNHAEELKIIASCIKRLTILRNVSYKVSRRLHNGIIIIGIEFSSQIPARDVDFFTKLLKRDLFEHCVENDYEISVLQDTRNHFDVACETLLQHIREQFGNCLSSNMNFIDVDVVPTTLGVLGKNILRQSEYPLALRIRATHPYDAYNLPEEEIEAAQKQCMRHIEGLPNLAAKYVQRVEIITI